MKYKSNPFTSDVLMLTKRDLEQLNNGITLVSTKPRLEVKFLKDEEVNNNAKPKEYIGNTIEAILMELVNLKDYKDNHGKDSYYLSTQPVLWQRARTILGNRKGKSNEQ